MTVIDDYLARVAPSQRQALERVRQVAKEMVPDAEEKISYGMPTLKFHGVNLIHFAAFKNHMSIFPTGDATLDDIEGLAQFRTSKGTLQFTEDKPISDALIRQIIAHRLKSIRS